MAAAPIPSPAMAIVGTIALASTTLTTIGAAILGTPAELGVSLVALTIVVVGLWRFVQ